MEKIFVVVINKDAGSEGGYDYRHYDKLVSEETVEALRWALKDSDFRLTVTAMKNIPLMQD